MVEAALAAHGSGYPCRIERTRQAIFRLLASGEYNRNLMPGSTSHATSRRSRVPRLLLTWEPRRQVFTSSLRALLRGPRASKGWPAAAGWPAKAGWPLAQYFHDSWVRCPAPLRALAASALWHVILFNFPFPMLQGAPEKPLLQPVRIEVTWYLPARDLPPLSPPAEPATAGKPLPRRGADAFHPRQTIISAPARPTHPRQTLIQPNAPLVPPKILPPLPNIVQWFESARPAKPRLSLSPQALAKLRPRKAARQPLKDLPVPALPNLETRAGELNIAATSMVNPQPRMPMVPAAVPAPGQRRAAPEAGPAPEIAPSVAQGSNTHAGFERLIALSASPAEPAPVIEVPPGNLMARLTISPEGTQPGVPGATGGGSGGTAGGTGPPEISITGGDANAASTLTGAAGIRPANPLSPGALPAKPEPRLAPEAAGRSLAVSPELMRPVPGLDRIKPGAPLEEILGPKRIHTLHVNMPNLTSAAGSWVLRFAELGQEGESEQAGDGRADLHGPVPLRKVDPKYPPALASAHVQGEVVLYAIIRKDGSVDSIQLLKSVDPQLDQNAMEALARWKFRPAERKGVPVELEAIVHIPFRAVAPL